MNQYELRVVANGRECMKREFEAEGDSSAVSKLPKVLGDRFILLTPEQASDDLVLRLYRLAETSRDANEQVFACFAKHNLDHEIESEQEIAEFAAIEAALGHSLQSLTEAM